MKTEDIIKGEQQYILQTYGRPEFVLERGNGAVQGKEKILESYSL